MVQMSWFNFLKRLFFQGTYLKPEKKERRRRWPLGSLKIKRLATLAPPAKDRALNEAEEEQNKHALTVAIATAAAAEAAIAAAQAAAKVVRLTGTPTSVHQPEEETQEFPGNEIRSSLPQCMHQCEMGIQNLAAIKIQTAFRGYLAKKALRALKGLVRLQAIIRGRAVRRQAMMTLKCLQSIVNIQSQVSTRRSQMAGETWNSSENKQLQDLEEKEIKMESKIQRRWDDSLLSQEEANAMFLSKKEALIRRERMKEYSFRQIERKNFQSETESDQTEANGGWRDWLEQWVDTQVARREEHENSDSDFFSRARTRKEKQFQFGNFQKQYYMEGSASPMSVPRRSFHHEKQNSVGEDNRLTCSYSVLPTYMAATESARAKARSVSSPKLRTGGPDAYSDIGSPSKNRLLLLPSMNNEAINNGRTEKFGVAPPRSQCSKGFPGPVKSTRTSKDLSFDSEISFQDWNRRF